MDVVPRTVPYKRIVERKAKEEKAAAQMALENGASAVNGTNGTATDDAADAATATEPADESAVEGAAEPVTDTESEDPNAQLEREIRAQSEKAAELLNGHRGANAAKDNEDVEMADA